MTNTFTTVGPSSGLHVALATFRNLVLPKLYEEERHYYMTIYSSSYENSGPINSDNELPPPGVLFHYSLTKQFNTRTFSRIQSREPQ